MSNCPKCGAAEYPLMHTEYDRWMCMSYRVNHSGQFQQTGRCFQQQVERLEARNAELVAAVGSLKSRAILICDLADGKGPCGLCHGCQYAAETNRIADQVLAAEGE